MRSVFLGRVKQIGVISILLIVILSYGLFFYVQSITESNIKESLFVQQRQRQLESTRSISNNIGSDINLILLMLDGLANSLYLQQGELFSEAAKNMMEEKYQEFSTIIDRLFVLDKNDIVALSITQRGSETFIGNDLSLREWVKETRSTLEPVFSNGFERQAIYTVFITQPIINRETNEYIGIVVTSIPTVKFFSHYGNVFDQSKQFLVAFDDEGTMLANGASDELVGENFFAPITQKFIKNNEVLNNLTRNLLAGHPGYGVYDYGKGERLTTEFPIIVDGKPIYFVQVVTPSAQIYSEINQVLFIERIKMFSLLAGTSAAVVVLIVFLIKWSSSLDNEVRRRTRELKESNERLAFANEQLKVQERVQKEFINIAAHELRTPIQPILGLSEILRSRLSRGTGVEGQDLLDIIIRNAKRLQRLAEDILDVTRIESQSLRLKIEEFDLNEVVSYVVDDYRNQLQKLNTGSMTTDISDNKVKLVYTANKENILIEADKGRIIQVVSNLMSNAIKFTRQIRSEGENGLQSQEQVKEKTISVSVEKNDPQKEAIVSIRDTGLGIDPEILPRLFSKFASKSFEGTGLGLFISKSIIEAHGGKIWATNNDDTNNDGSKGATFYFSLVLTQKQHENVHARMDGR